MSSHAEDNDIETEKSLLFDTFRKTSFEDQEKRYEATVDLLDEFHDLLYLQHGDDVNSKNLNVFLKEFRKKYETKNIEKDSGCLNDKPVVIKSEESSSDDTSGCIAIEPNFLINSDSQEPMSPANSQSSDSESLNYSTMPLVQIDDHSVKKFLSESFSQNRDGAHDSLALQFHKRKQLKTDRKAAIKSGRKRKLSKSSNQNADEIYQSDSDDGEAIILDEPGTSC